MLQEVGFNQSVQLFPEPPTLRHLCSSARLRLEEGSRRCPRAGCSAPGWVLGPREGARPQGGVLGPQGGVLGPQGGVLGPRVGTRPQGGVLGPQGGVLGPWVLGPQGRLLGPRGRCSTLRAGCSAPREGCSAPTVGCSAPRVGCSGPRAGCLACRTGCSSPREGCLAPKEGCLAPRAGYLGPRVGCSAPSKDCLAPRERCSAPRAGCLGPRVGCLAPSKDCSAPSEDCSARKEGCSAPREGCSAPKEGCSAPRTGCSDLPRMAVPADLPCPVSSLRKQELHQSLSPWQHGDEIGFEPCGRLCQACTPWSQAPPGTLALAVPAAACGSSWGRGRPWGKLTMPPPRGSQVAGPHTTAQTPRRSVSGDKSHSLNKAWGVSTSHENLQKRVHTHRRKCGAKSPEPKKRITTCELYLPPGKRRGLGWAGSKQILPARILYVFILF